MAWSDERRAIQYDASLKEHINSPSAAKVKAVSDTLHLMVPGLSVLDAYAIAQSINAGRVDESAQKLFQQALVAIKLSDSDYIAETKDQIDRRIRHSVESVESASERMKLARQNEDSRYLVSVEAGRILQDSIMNILLKVIEGRTKHFTDDQTQIIKRLNSQFDLRIERAGLFIPCWTTTRKSDAAFCLNRFQDCRSELVHRLLQTGREGNMPGTHVGHHNYF